MTGESHPGFETEHDALPTTGQRLKTALKIIFWFCLLCFALVSLIGYYAYQEFQEARARSDHRRWVEQRDSMPAPFEPVEITVEDGEFSPARSPSVRGGRRTPGVADGNPGGGLPKTDEAAPSDASPSDEHRVAQNEAGIVINEVFFHPPSSWDQPEDPDQEFVELYNAGTDPVSLDGYEFTKGIKIVFPEVTIPADGYLVVAANRAVFLRQHRGVKLVIGGWDGRLSNSGEEIQLEDPEGKKIDAVRYADQGDWAQRGSENSSSGYQGNVVFRSTGFRSSRNYGSRGGWSWMNPADGDGHSLELASPAVTNQCGQNWRPSASKGGTPGARNSRYSPDIAPVIRDVVHSPAIPTPADSVVVTAELRDELDEGSSSEIYWRASGSRNAGAFRKVAMTADGGTFFGEIPPQRQGTIVEFFVRATDGNYTRNWPAETLQGQAANALYQVEDKVIVPNPGFGLYRLIMTQGDRKNFQSMSRHSDAQVNATLIADDGAGPKVRYNCGVRYRGAGSRDHIPTPMRVNIPSDTPWHGSTRMNLNSRYSWLQHIGMKVFADAGVRAPDSRPVEVWMNGQDLMRRRGAQGRLALGEKATDQKLNTLTQKSSSKYDYGYFVHLEPLGSEWIKRHIPLDADGNSYKKVRPDTDWAYRRGSVRRYMKDGWSKGSNAAAADWTDLDTFLNVMNNSSRHSDYLERVKKVAHLEQWYSWFGVNAILANGEGGLAKGIDDDYGIYRGEVDTRFQLLPHDMDTIVGRGDGSRINDPYRTLFDFAEGGDEIDALEELFEEGAVRRRYLQHIRMLVSGTFAEMRFEPLIANELRGWSSNREIQQIFSWMKSRRVYAMSEVEGVLGSSLPPLPVPKADASADAKAVDGLRLSEVLADSANGSPDYIELHNASGSPVNASGLLLTDNAEKPSKFAIPGGTVIAPGGYKVVTSDEAEFKLEGSGEGVYLFTADGETELDSVVFGLQIPGSSIGRTADGVRWTLNEPTPGNPNRPVTTASPANLCINEFLVHPHLLFDTDFVELFNRGAQPVALGGVRVTDDPFNFPERFSFPPLSFIQGKGFAVLKAMGQDAKDGDARQLPMKFAYEYGHIHVAGSNGVRIDQVSYQCQRQDISRGRAMDGGAELQYFSGPTPASSNTGRSPALAGAGKPMLDGLRITEIMFHPKDPQGAEFVEITNIGSAVLDLKGVRFAQGIEFEFKKSLPLQAGASAVVVSDKAAFATQYGDDLSVAGEFKGKLSNKGETLQLKLPKPLEVLIVSVDFDDKWYPDSDGLGKSLVLRSGSKSREDFAKRGAWKASEQDGGSPGRVE